MSKETENLIEAIKIVALGNQTNFALKVSKESGKKLSQQLVHFWIKNKKPCSPKYCVAVERLSGGKITAHDLNPSVFPSTDKAAA